MIEQQVFNLANFMPTSLCITENSVTPTRRMHVSESDYYEDLTKQDPYKILGLMGFTPMPKVPVHIKGSEISEFFRDSHVFITGATGFLGKIVLEKLIRSLPNLDHIYLLIRPKRGKNGHERLNDILKQQVFLRMQTEVPHYLSKMTVVEGDISEPGLGLSAEDRQMLIDNVNVVIHSAADVRFVEPLKSTIKSNVFGTKRVLELCKEILQLKAVVHVSTAFSHCVRSCIEEKIYKIHTDYKEVMNILEKTPDSDIEDVTTRIIKDWPNTYTFGKALCEQMIAEEMGYLPLCIVRPSIVVPTYKEPVRGWTDNLYGPVGLELGVGLGALHCGVVNMEASADFVPVDFVANFVLAAAWKTGSETLNEEVMVYNFTATSVRPTCWKDMIHFLLCIKHIWPFQHAIWYTSYINTSSKMYDLAHLVLHTVPGLILDKVAVMMGKQARLSKVYNKAYVMIKQIAYFAGNTWRWQSDNVWQVWKEMSVEDQKLFYFDLASINFKEHLLISKLGVRHFILKEKMESLAASVRKNNKLYWLHKAVQVTFGFAALKLMAMMSHYVPI